MTSFLSRLFFVVLVIGVSNGQLSSNFYSSTCPNLLTIIRTAVNSAVSSESRMGASLLRLHFHDCFVNVSLLYTYNISPMILFLKFNLWVFFMCMHHDYLYVVSPSIFCEYIGPPTHQPVDSNHPHNISYIFYFWKRKRKLAFLFTLLHSNDQSRAPIDSNLKFS